MVMTDDFASRYNSFYRQLTQIFYLPFFPLTLMCQGRSVVFDLKFLPESISSGFGPQGRAEWGKTQEILIQTSIPLVAPPRSRADVSIVENRPILSATPEFSEHIFDSFPLPS